MNEQLQAFARTTLLDGLDKLPHKQRDTFRLMYGRLNGKRKVEDSLAMSIVDVVDEIPPEKLDWAMQQVQRSLQAQASAFSEAK